MTPEQRDAMKQALEALEMWCPMTATYLNTREKAITALTAAFANDALDKMAENARELGLDYVASSDTSKERVAETPKKVHEQPAQQESVAWEHHAKKLTQWLYCMSYNDSYFGEPAGLVKQVTGELNRLIDARPPAREWVGLTDEEIETLMDTYDVAAIDYARAIEAKLKDKNGY